MGEFNFSEAGKNFEQIKPKRHYTYSDNRVLSRPIIHEFDADSDSEADELFRLFIQERGLDLSDSEIIRGSVEN